MPEVVAKPIRLSPQDRQQRKAIRGRRASGPLTAEEIAGAQVLRTYCEAHYGRMSMLAKLVESDLAAMCRYTKGQDRMSVETAMALELASAGDLRAEVLCPRHKQLIAAFRGRP